MKTTKMICKDNEVSWYDGYHTCWYSEEEIKKAISEVKKWEHHDLSKDWEIELFNKLFNAPDLSSRSSDEDSLNKDQTKFETGALE